VGLVAGRVLGVPAIAWNVRCARLEREDHARSLFWLRTVLARLSSVPDAVVANSLEGRRVHELLGYRAHRWEVIPNGFDTEAFAPAPESRSKTRASLLVPEEAPLVGMLARYHPIKDHRTFLQACALVASERPDTRFVLAGRRVDGKNQELKGLVKQCGLDGRVHLCGETNSAAAFLSALDVAVSASYSEAFPNVVGEAMASGVPVVVTDAGDSARIVGDTGSVVPPRDPDALAAAILGMLDLSRGDRTAVGLRGRDRITANFSLDAMVMRYERLYEDLAGRAA